MLHRSYAMVLMGLVFLFSAANCSEDGLVGIPDICKTNVDCDDGDPCTLDMCVPRVECRNILAEDGFSCEADQGVSICIDGRCGESVCGDGFTDLNFLEECDDGNLEAGDGCAPDCTNARPQVLISYPERGATLDGIRRVTVIGSVQDKGVGIESLTVNGEPVRVDVGGGFEYTLQAEHGLNFVEAKLISKGGRKDSTSVGFYHSSAYLPYALNERETEGINDGFVYRLGQEAFDDGHHPCTMVDGVYQCDEVDDLATVGEILLNNLSADDLTESLTFFEESYPFLGESLNVGVIPPLNVGLGTLTLDGELGFYGDVVVKSHVVDLDFNQLALSLLARSGGLDATVAVAHEGGVPGFNITVRTSAAVNVEARFNYVSAVLDMGGAQLDSMMIICALLPPMAPYNTICRNLQAPEEPLAPLAGFDPSPQAWIDSGLTIDDMTLEATFNITTDPAGEVTVALVRGDVEFHDSMIDLDAIRDMQIDLGDIQILGGLAVLDLGRVPLSAIAQGLDTGLDFFTDFIFDELQGTLERAIGLLLLNPLDPMNVGSAVKHLITTMELDQDLLVEPYGRFQTEGPALHLKSQLRSVEFEAAEPGDLNTGGMTAGFDTLISAPRAINREPLGVMLRDGCYHSEYTPLRFIEEQPMEVAQYVDALNQGVYGAWWNGAFNGTLVPTDSTRWSTEGAGISTYSLALEFFSAPTFTSCGSMNPRLQVADVRVEGTYVEHGTEYSVMGYANYSLPVAWSHAGGQVTFNVVDTGERLSHFEIVSGTVEETDASRIGALVESAIAEELIAHYAADILSAYPVLSFDLAAMYELESAAVLEMAPTASYHSEGYEVIAGTNH